MFVFPFLTDDELTENMKRMAEDRSYQLKTRRDAFSEQEGCPKCGNPGEFIRMALCCPEHGFFGGI